MESPDFVKIITERRILRAVAVNAIRGTLRDSGKL